MIFRGEVLGDDTVQGDTQVSRLKVPGNSSKCLSTERLGCQMSYAGVIEVYPDDGRTWGKRKTMPKGK